MELYQTSDLIKKYGAREYLRNLRERLTLGEIDRDHFAHAAARAYLSDGKPLRAMALLNTLDAGFDPGPDHPSVRELASCAGTAWSAQPYATCALNMIVKNEEACLAGALDSVDDIMDEIVIGDTGSVDATQEIALRYGATVSTIAWEDDFSRARNRVIENSTCDWIFWMDADDRLDPRCRVMLRDLWRTGRPQAAAACVSNVTPGAPGPEFLQFRLFPRDPEIRFERRIHEQVVMSAARKGLPCIPYESIRIIHRGYADRDLHLRKAARNKPLILQHVAEHPGDLVMRLSLGECHTVLNEADAAIAVFRDIADDPENHTRDRDAYAWAHLNAGRLYWATGNRREAKRYLYRSLLLDRGILESYYLLGKIFHAEGNTERAFYFFVKAAQLTPRLQLMAATDRVWIRMESLYYVADILLNWGKFPQAEEMLDRALLTFPRVVQYHTLMGKALLAQAKLKGAAACFAHALSMAPTRNPDAYLGLAAVYHTLGNSTRAADFLRQALEKDSATAAVYAMIGDLHFDMHNSRDALEAYEAAIAEGNGSTPEGVLLRAASSAADLAETGKAREFIEKVLHRNPANEKAVRMLGTLAMEQRAA